MRRTFFSTELTPLPLERPLLIAEKATLQVALRQEQRQRRLRITASGSSTATVHCDGVTGWAVSIAGDDGVFTNGLAQMSAQTVDATPADTGPQQGRLFWSKR